MSRHLNSARRAREALDHAEDELNNLESSMKVNTATIKHMREMQRKIGLEANLIALKHFGRTVDKYSGFRKSGIKRLGTQDFSDLKLPVAANKTRSLVKPNRRSTLGR